MMTLDEAWRIFDSPERVAPFEMTSVLTQMEHPVLFKPFLTLHPCRTQELLERTPNSRNKVLTFLSAIGPTVYLSVDLRFGLDSDSKE